MSSRVVCLLPARNCERDLGGCLESISTFADHVVALDDGSTDATGDVLAASPLVEILLTNPRRASYRGWDDIANRNRLLAAAAELEPDWIMSLDADERVDPDDGEALRRFLAGKARGGWGYLFPVFAMVDDEQHYHLLPLWVGRLFAYEPGVHFNGARLHAVLLPSTIPRSRWLETTIRIKHLGGLSEERRRGRFEKYREADPDCEFQPTYSHLLAAPTKVERWSPRPDGLPVVAGDLGQLSPRWARAGGQP
jgi:glycosyltransferase involved in cell wall biosynthesis